MCINIKVLTVEVEQSPHLVMVHRSLVELRVGQGVSLEVQHFGMVSQVVLMQIGLGWVALWEVGLD